MYGFLWYSPLLRIAPFFVGTVRVLASSLLPVLSTILFISLPRVISVRRNDKLSLVIQDKVNAKTSASNLDSISRSEVFDDTLSDLLETERFLAMGIRPRVCSSLEKLAQSLGEQIEILRAEEKRAPPGMESASEMSLRVGLN